MNEMKCEMAVFLEPSSKMCGKTLMTLFLTAKVLIGKIIAFLLGNFSV